MQDLIWVNDDAVLITIINENSGRKCADYDPCGPQSVALHRISTGKATPVLAGTDICDYGLSGFDGKSVTAIKTCGKTAKDWATADSKEKGLTRSRGSTPLPGKFRPEHTRHGKCSRCREVSGNAFLANRTDAFRRAAGLMTDSDIDRDILSHRHNREHFALGLSAAVAASTVIESSSSTSESAFSSAGGGAGSGRGCW